jgi:adenylyltransferase/sulfurtransferase
MAVRRGSACYRCIYEAPPPPELAPACSEVGVMGSAAGVLGQLMALLAVRLAAGEDAAGELIVADLRQTSVRTLHPGAREGCPACSDPDRKPQLPPTSGPTCATS